MGIVGDGPRAVPIVWRYDKRDAGYWDRCRTSSF